MTVARIVGTVGRTIVAFGLILLLFVAYQLWGTALQHALAQNDLEEDFEQNLVVARALPEAATEDADMPEPTAESSVTVVDSITGAAADVAAGDAVSYDDDVIDLLPLLYPPQGEATARIRIPAIGVDEIVVAGVQAEDLRKGPGLYDFSPLPGQPGNAAIAGHRTTYGAPFERLDELQPDDEITVQTLQGTFTYRVFAQGGDDGEQRGHYIVPPTAVGVLDDYGDNRITLTACHPKYTARERLIVQAGLVGEPRIALPRPGEATSAAGSDQLATEEVRRPSAATPAASGLTATDVQAAGFGQGLGGDTGAVRGVITWGLAGLAIWMTAWFVAHRWRRWPAYVTGTLPFLGVLFVLFSHVDRALPAY